MHVLCLETVKENRPLLMFPLLWPQGHSLLSRLQFISTAIFSEVQTVRNDMITIKDKQMCPECLSLSSVSHYRLVPCLFCFNGSDWNTASQSDKNRIYPGRAQDFINAEVPKLIFLVGFRGMSPRENLDFPDLHVCFKVFKGKKPPKNNRII